MEKYKEWSNMSKKSSNFAVNGVTMSTSKHYGRRSV